MCIEGSLSAFGIDADVTGRVGGIYLVDGDVLFGAGVIADSTADYGCIFCNYYSAIITN